MSRRIAVVLTGLVLLMGAGVVTGQPASAAVAIELRGVVSCDAGPVVGIWANSSGGGSSWVTNRQAFPNRSEVNVYHAIITTNLPTIVRLDVGCGGTPAAWGSNNHSPNLSIGGMGYTSLNLWCHNNGACNWAANGSGSAPSPSFNPASGVCWCTWRAADFWKQMTGRYPNWGGDAGYWDDNAAARGWTVSAPNPSPAARPRSLFITQPTARNSAGHVGFVRDVRIYNGATQILISDRNSDGSCLNGTQAVFDRTDAWINVAPDMRFIIPPPVGAI